MIIINETQLREILHGYIRYYNAQRTHLEINKESPETREVQADGEIDKVAVSNGLHYYYFREAA